MNELQRMIQEKIDAGGKILSIYLTAGYPHAAATVPLLQTIIEAGADLIELGVPFSDPLADGPTIQAASQASLASGMTLSTALAQLAEFKRRHATPVVLMGYANPFMQFGWENLCREARRAGASGFIIPDMPLEESEDVYEMMLEHELSLIDLISPNTSPARVQRIDARAQAFIYAVSLTGVTGARAALPPESELFLLRLKELVSSPVLAGFGVSGPETAVQLAKCCDGVIIGSAVIQRIAAAANLDGACKSAHDFVSKIRAALDCIPAQDNGRLRGANAGANGKSGRVKMPAEHESK